MINYTLMYDYNVLQPRVPISIVISIAPKNNPLSESTLYGQPLSIFFKFESGTSMAFSFISKLMHNCQCPGYTGPWLSGYLTMFRIFIVVFNLHMVFLLRDWRDGPIKQRT
ncbi:hypothetical protein BC833DRAFT_569041 [Globomyces pollinis-pini]|nr:hypothetical protein BC833DRAFT_569041 [Globomyces pollinis-pini]